VRDKRDLRDKIRSFLSGRTLEEYKSEGCMLLTEVLEMLDIVGGEMRAGTLTHLVRLIDDLREERESLKTEVVYLRHKIERINQ